MVEVWSIVSVMSIVSTTPADLSIISSEKGSPAFSRVHVFVVFPMVLEGLTFSPDHLETFPPNTSVSISLSILTVVVVVDCIDPWVNCGVTVWADAGAANSSNRSSFFIPFFHG